MNFEEISKKVKKFSKDTMVEVQKMNEVRQLNGKVNEEKRYLNKLYLEMGKKLYDKYKDADTAPEGFEAEFRKITERYSVMDLLQDEIRQVKGVVLCPCCNMEVAATERFCSNCGNRMPEPVKIEGKEDGEVIDSADGENKEADTEETAETVVDVEAEDVTESSVQEETAETVVDVEAEDVTESSVQEETAEEECDAEAVEEEVAEAKSDAKADVTEKIVEESDAARPEEEVTEEVPGEDAGAATEEALEGAEETSEEIPAEAEAAAEELKETVQTDKTDEVAAEADEAAAAKASEKPKEE